MSDRGDNFEREMRKQLEMDGWFVARAAGSLGDADLVATRYVTEGPLNDPLAAVWLIECKTTAQGPYERFSPADRQKLSKAARRAGASAWLVWRPPRGTLRWIHESDWPRSKTEADHAYENVRATTNARTRKDSHD